MQEELTKNHLIYLTPSKKIPRRLEHFKKTKPRTEEGFVRVPLPSEHIYYLFILMMETPSEEAWSPNEKSGRRGRSQHSALSRARPQAPWHAYASLRTHALSCVIPHLVTICHCHPWHVTPLQTDLTPVPSLTLGWEAVVIGIEIAGREWLISLWHNPNTARNEGSALFKGGGFLF